MADVDLNRLVSLLANADALFMPFASRATLDIVDGIESIISVYPPQPDRDRAKTFNTYVRGQGKYPRSAFMRDAREPGKYRTKRVNRSKIRMTSQRMDNRFVKSVTQTKDAIIGNLTNGATYSGYVIGQENGTPHQQAFHKETGWVSTEEAIASVMPQVGPIMEGAVSDFIGSLE
jgi:hypothetical protein